MLLDTICHGSNIGCVGVYKADPQPGAALAGGAGRGTGISIGVTLSPLRSTRLGKPSQGEGDTGLYRAEIRRIHAGEGYYQAAAKESVSRGYPTQVPSTGGRPCPSGPWASCPTRDWAKQS